MYPCIDLAVCWLIGCGCGVVTDVGCAYGVDGVVYGDVSCTGVVVDCRDTDAGVVVCVVLYFIF